MVLILVIVNSCSEGDEADVRWDRRESISACIASSLEVKASTMARKSESVLVLGGIAN